jgi:ribosomal protein S16
MLTIRFKPVGRKHRKSYRIVVAEKQSHPTKSFLEVLGWYNPYSKESALKEDRLKYYIGLNIEISDSVKSLLKKNSLIK